MSHSFVPGDRVRIAARASGSVYEIDSVDSPCVIRLRGFIGGHIHPARLALVESVLDRARREAGALAAQFLGIESLAPRHSDSLDFHDVSVLSLEAALVAAFQAGRRSAGRDS